MRAARHAKGWTIEKLAERSGLPWTYVGQVERGVRNLTLVNILRLAKARRSGGGRIPCATH